MPLRIQEGAERRQVTILHCDIVNSTAVVDKLDPEEVLTLMEAYLDRWIEIVEQHRGTFVGYTGDGFHAYFGYPFAREDAAVDALGTAIAVSEMFAEDDNPIQQELECRIGIATGQVVIAQAGAQAIARSLVAFGSAPCLATRLEQAANPGHILIDRATCKLVQGHFVLQEFGAIPAKGFKQDVFAWEVVRKRRPGPRFDASHLSPFVGRDHQQQTMAERWQSVIAGRGQAVLLVGEPGIGKSRLAFEFEQSVAGQTEQVFRFQCSNLNTSTPLHPWLHWIEQVADITQQDDANLARSKLQNCLEDRFGFSDELIRSSEAVMGYSMEKSAGEGGPPSQKLLTRLQHALVDNLIATTENAPAFILVEDVHWMDASTGRVIELLLEYIADHKLLLVMTSRPDRAPNYDVEHVTELSLTRLDEMAVGELVGAFLSDAEVGTNVETLMTTIRKCEGNPLFVEEFTKHYLEQDGAATATSSDGRSEDDVPILLQGSLLERIDTAGKGKRTAQLAAVIGREFDPGLLIKLSDESPVVVQRHLDQLNDLNILSRTAINDRTYYSFRHALLREAVYSSLLHAARSEIHCNVATLLATERQGYSAEVIARHYEECGRYNLAFQYWLEAGQHALQNGATKEAVNLLAEADGLVVRLDDAPQTLGDIAEMYLAYAHALNAAHGVAAEPIKYYRKAEKYAGQLDDTRLLSTSLDWQFGVLFNAGKLAASLLPAQKLKQLGTSTNDTSAMASGYQAVGMAHFMRGEFEDACRQFEEGLQVSADYVSGEHCFPSMTLSYLGWTHLVLGNHEKAIACAEQSVASARRESPHAIASSLSNSSYVFQSIGAVDKVYTLTDELLEFAAKHGEHMILERGAMTRSWADCISGRNYQAVDAVEAHINQLLSFGEEIEFTYHFGILAELQIRQQKFAAAANALARALEIANKNGEHFYLAELYRLMHCVLEAEPTLRAPEDSSDYLAMANQVARSQNAKTWLERSAGHPGMTAPTRPGAVAIK